MTRGTGTYWDIPPAEMTATHRAEKEFRPARVKTIPPLHLSSVKHKLDICWRLTNPAYTLHLFFRQRCHGIERELYIVPQRHELRVPCPVFGALLC